MPKVGPLVRTELKLQLHALTPEPAWSSLSCRLLLEYFMFNPS